MPTTSNIEELSQKAKFIFKGTVKERHAATLPEVPVTNSTLIVTVDEIIRAPEMLRDFAGKDITVQLGKGQSVKVGQQRIFFTNGWIFGTSIGVVSVGHIAATAAPSRRAVAAVQALPDRVLQERAARAELVVSGRVVEVREAPRPANAPISEHDPVWYEAVVQVDAVAKGALNDPSTGQVVVKFANSDDVLWRNTPKFHVHQEGVWMLGDTSAEPLLLAATGVGTEEYLAIEPIDFQSKEQFERVRSLIQ